jgi:two-component system sensor kinase FixL
MVRHTRARTGTFLVSFVLVPYGVNPLFGDIIHPVMRGWGTLRGAYFRLPHHYLTRAGFLAIASIAFADWRIGPNISLGVLYLLPLSLMAPRLTRAEIVSTAIACAGLFELFNPFAADAHLFARLLMACLAFAGTSLFIRELALDHRRALEHEAGLRLRAEQQARLVVESSLAALIATDAAGRIVLANEAAHSLFGFQPGALAGAAAGDLLPELQPSVCSVQTGISRRIIECTARHRDGTRFFAQVWIAAIPTDGGPLTAALVFDSSDNRRSREEELLHHNLASCRVLLGGVWHELRNFAAALETLHSGLARSSDLSTRPEIRALGSLSEAFSKLISDGAQAGLVCRPETVDLRNVLDDLQIILGPALSEIGATARWHIPGSLPAGLGDSRHLLQVFLNLARNALRALRDAPVRELRVRASASDGRISVEFWNSGPAAANPHLLFQAFRSGAGSTGLGLYLSRALMRESGGDLRYAPTAAGCCFVVDVPAALEIARGAA